MERKRAALRFNDLFYPEPNEKFLKLETNFAKYDETYLEWLYVDEESGELLGNYFQDSTEILLSADPNCDYSQGLDYHYYILQDLFVYEIKKPNIQKSAHPALHSSCLEKRLTQSKLTRLNNEYIDYLLLKSRKPMKSIYKKIGTNYGKVRPQNFKYTEYDESENEDFVRLVINGMDSDLLYNRYNSILSATKKFSKLLISQRRSTYAFSSLLHVYIELFDPSIDILWKYIVMAEDEYEDKMNLNDSCVQLLYYVTYIMNNAIDSTSSKFADFCDTLSPRIKQQMLDDYDYQMPLFFSVMAPALMAISSFLRSVIPMKCLRALLIMIQRFIMQKFVTDQNPDAYYVQFKPEGNR